MATILVTRPEVDAERTAARLRADGHEVILSPVLILRQLDAAPPAERVDAIVVTSANALWLGRDEVRQALAGRPVFAVGDQSADVVHGLGYQDVRSAGGTASDLVELVFRDLAPPARLLAPVGRVHGEEWMAALRERGFEVTPVIVYDAESAEQLSAEAVAGLRYDIVDAVLHYSTRTAQTFIELADRGGARDKLARLKHACLSREIADSLPDDLRARAVAAEAPNEDSLFAALQAALADETPAAEIIESEETPARAKRPARQRAPRIIDSEAKVISDAPADAAAENAAPAESPPAIEPPAAPIAALTSASPEASAEKIAQQDNARIVEAPAPPAKPAPSERTSAQAEASANATTGAPRATTQQRPATPPPAKPSITTPLLAGGFAGAAAGACIAFWASSILTPPTRPAPDLDARLSSFVSRNDLAAAQQKIDAAAAAFTRDRDALRADIAALAKKLDEAPVPTPAPAAADDPDARRAAAANAQALQALSQQMQALERRTDEIARAAAAPQPATNDVTAVVRRHALASAVAQSLMRGAAYRTELDALKSLGASAEQIAALDAFANGGAPSARVLDDEFRALAPKLLQQARDAAPNESLADRIAASFKQLVRIRPIGDAKGDDAASLVARIEASLQRGAIADAVAAYDKLPESARAIGADWRKKAQQRAGAGAAAQAMLDAAARALSAPSN